MTPEHILPDFQQTGLCLIPLSHNLEENGRLTTVIPTSFVTEVVMSVLRDIRKEARLSQKAFGDLFHVDQTTVSKWEREISLPDLNLGMKISEQFGISLDRIYRNPLSFSTLSFPVFDEYRQGPSDRSVLETNETFDTNYREIAYYLKESDIASRMVSDREIADSFIVMRVVDNAMEPRFCENDLVLILKDSEEHDSRVCAVCIEGSPARLYRLTKHKNGVSLLSYNPSFEPIFIPRSELDKGRTSIVGRVVGLRGRIR
jgi:repressor LexA